MKTKWILLPVLGVLTWLVVATIAQPHEGLTTKEFMREKLAHSQKRWKRWRSRISSPSRSNRKN
jgi:hypothetical protein